MEMHLDDLDKSEQNISSNIKKQQSDKEKSKENILDQKNSKIISEEQDLLEDKKGDFTWKINE